nr:MAG TPA: hypothetical protein [Caudoviricetes sp.]
MRVRNKTHILIKGYAIRHKLRRLILWKKISR